MTYITPHKLFAHVDRIAAWRTGIASPVTVEWDLSNRCHLGCQSCHFRHTHIKGPWSSKPRLLPMAYEGTGDLADLGLIKRASQEMGRAGVKSVIWSGGGEPTTHPHFTAALGLATDAGLEQGMYTAGGLLNRADARTLAHHATWVVVSLDCADGATYAKEKGVPAGLFELACNGARYLAEAGSCVVGVSFLLHAGNWHEAPSMLMLAQSLGATYTTFRPTIDTEANAPAVCASSRDWITEALPLLRQLADEPDVELDVDRFLEYRDWTGRSYDACYGIRLNTTITPDGRVWVCPQRRGIAGSELGDLRRDSFTELWSRHPRQWTDFSACRVMCRLHLVNEQYAAIEQPRAHEAFV